MPATVEQNDSDTGDQKPDRRLTGVGALWRT